MSRGSRCSAGWFWGGVCLPVVSFPLTSWSQGVPRGLGSHTAVLPTNTPLSRADTASLHPKDQFLLLEEDFSRTLQGALQAGRGVSAHTGGPGGGLCLPVPTLIALLFSPHGKCRDRLKTLTLEKNVTVMICAVIHQTPPGSPRQALRPAQPVRHGLPP